MAMGVRKGAWLQLRPATSNSVPHSWSSLALRHTSYVALGKSLLSGFGTMTLGQGGKVEVVIIALSQMILGAFWMRDNGR